MHVHRRGCLNWSIFNNGLSKTPCHTPLTIFICYYDLAIMKDMKSSMFAAFVEIFLQLEISDQIGEQ